MSTVTKRIALDRRVCVVREGRIDIRPERGAILGPLLGLSVSVALFVAVALFASDLPAGALAAMLLPGLVLGPFSAMAFVHSILGAYVIIDAKKQSVTFQQGVLGLGLGTVELAPFWKIDRLEVQDLPLGEVTPKGPPPLLDLRAWDIVLVKTSGKQLSIGQVVAANAPDLLDEGFDRALDAAEAMAALVGRPVLITAAVEERVLSEAEGPVEGRHGKTAHPVAEGDSPVAQGDSLRRGREPVEGRAPSQVEGPVLSEVEGTSGEPAEGSQHA